MDKGGWDMVRKCPQNYCLIVFSSVRQEMVGIWIGVVSRCMGTLTVVLARMSAFGLPRWDRRDSRKDGWKQ